MAHRQAIQPDGEQFGERVVMAKAFLRSVRSGKRRAAIADLASISRKEIEDVMDKQVKPALVKSHEKIVEDWTSDVGFAAKKVIKSDRIVVYVFPTGKDKKVWWYVDRGTRPHKIRAKNAPRLAFMMTTDGRGNFVRGAYVPKTRPVAQVVSGGGYVPKPRALARPIEVDHPGSEGRGFTEQIANEILPEFRREVENAFRRVKRRVSE
jgi:hypothetical protein